VHWLQAPACRDEQKCLQDMVHALEARTPDADELAKLMHPFVGEWWYFAESDIEEDDPTMSFSDTGYETDTMEEAGVEMRQRDVLTKDSGGGQETNLDSEVTVEDLSIHSEHSIHFDEAAGARKVFLARGMAPLDAATRNLIRINERVTETDGEAEHESNN